MTKTMSYMLPKKVQSYLQIILSSVLFSFLVIILRILVRHNHDETYLT